MKYTIHIKNMVCPRCISAVGSILQNLKIEVLSIDLGEVVLVNSLKKNKKESLEKELLKEGFELLTNNNSKIIEQIKATIIAEIHHSNSDEKVNLSDSLSTKLNKEYSSLTKLFSSVEGKTIEQFVLHQKIEKVKALLFYNEYTLSEIAIQLHYSSTAHLSSQFKKVTGMTPTIFKRMKSNCRKPLDSL